jgi:hypothetical protein
VRPVNRFLVAMLVVIVLMFILDTHAKADTWGVASVTSYHFDDGNHNQKNLGVGLEQTINEDWSVMAGEYKNSMYRTSVYAGVVWKPLRLGDFHFGFAGGAITGYLSHPVPLAVPTMSWEHQRIGANLFFAPHVKDAPGVLGLQLKFKF